MLVAALLRYVLTPVGGDDMVHEYGTVAGKRD